MPVSHVVYWDGVDLKTAIIEGFQLMEGLDHIVGIIYATPSVMKNIVFAMPDDITFNYIPEGIGTLRTAYLKYRPMADEREIRLVSVDGSIIVRILHK